MKIKSIIDKNFKSSEELISMFLGLVIVVVVVGLIFNFFQKRRGSVDLSGVTDQALVETGSLTGTLTGAASKTPTKGSLVIPTVAVKGRYVVKSGDSLWKIAETIYGSGYNWVDIARQNYLKNPGYLTVGQNLNLPDVAKRVPVTLTTEDKLITADDYTVVKGDSLWKIAVRKYADGYRWVEIWNANKNVIFDANKLEIGMKLNLPTMK